MSKLHQNLVNKVGFDDDITLLYFLEKYRILDINCLCSISKTIHISSFLDIKLDVDDDSEVIPITKDKTNLTLGYRKGAYINTSIYELQLPYDITFVEILPYNFDVIYAKYIGKVFEEEIDYLILFRLFIIDCINRGGTDIHFYPCFINNTYQYKCFYRLSDYIESSVYPLDEKTLSGMLKHVIRHKSNNLAGDIDIPGGIDTKINNPLDDGNYSMRLAISSCIEGYHAVGRIQRPNTTAYGMKGLGFSKKIVDKLKILSEKETGLTIITGPPKSGKNVTGYAMLKYISDNKRIKMVEYGSPVENGLPFPQIDYHGDLDVLISLISRAKKQDIDLAFICEIPTRGVARGISDLVTSSIGVISTLHLDRIWHLPIKLKDYYDRDFRDIFSHLNGIINQRLFVKLCSHCRQQVNYEHFDEATQKYLEELDTKYCYVPKGCDNCVDGYEFDGRIPFAEVLIFEEDLKRKLINLDSTIEMESYIREYMYNNKLNIEIDLKEALELGIIDVKQIMSKF